MTKVIISLVFIACVTITTALVLSDPVNQYNRLEKSRQSQYQNAQVFDASMNFFNLLAFVFIFALVLLIIIGARALHVRFVDRESLNEHRGFEAYKYEMETQYKYTQPNFSGVHQVTFSPRDSHDQTNSVTQHHRQPKQLSNGLDTPTIDLSPLDIVRPVPSFREAIEQSTKDSLVLGYNETGEAVTGSLDYMYSFSNGGGTGSGKTSTAVYLAAQSVAHGAELIIIDPHAGHSESLANKIAPLSSAYLCDVASEPKEMLDTISFTQSIFDARKSGNMNCDNYIILMCDEWLALMRGSLKDDFQRLAECITQEGRKYKIIAVFMSHMWNKNKSGDMRDTLASHVIHRTRTELARHQTGLSARELPSDIMRLKNGQFYLLDIFGDIQKLQAPRVTMDDLEQLAQSLFMASKPLPKTFQTSSAYSNPIGFIQSVEVPQEVRGSTTETQETIPTAEEAEIVRMFDSGEDITAITKKISGVTSGRKYTETLERVNAVIRKFY